tara:strand:+ start:358 stop:1551 length:1194 start_codon:yes stop_codon:yes gene_type:complete
MFGFGSHVPERECGVIVDIGSGSVGAALIVSEPDQEKPLFLWSGREHVVLGNSETGEVALRHINTALINVFLQLGSAGMKQLHEHDAGLKITHMQVAISAPWAHTVIKRVNYTDEHPFAVTPELLEELSNTAEKQATEAILKNTLLQENGTVVLDNKPIGVITNGYNVPHVTNAQTRELSLAHLSALAQKRTLEIVEDSKNKILPKTTLYTHSFMYIYYEVMQQSVPDTKEACLIDITSESTEVGIIREGLLTHVTHMPYGTYTLAREIATACNIPKEEAYTYLKGGKSFVDTKLSKAKKNDITIILTAYEERLAKLLQSTGDILAIPKSIFMHTDVHTEKFFKHHISEASKIATGMEHVIHLITSTFLKTDGTHDSALNLSGIYFHQKHREALEES